MRSSLRTLLVLSASLTAASQAGADDGGSPPSPEEIIARYCDDAQLTCLTAPIEFAKTIEQPWAFQWDTGWIPQNYDALQVRFTVSLPAETTVKLSGALEAAWPPAITLATPGGRQGLLEFDYGFEVTGEGRINLSVAGNDVNWEGDLPLGSFFPTNFRITASEPFDSWAFPPDVAQASGATPLNKLFELNVLDLYGIPSLIAKGGLRLSVSGALTGTYQTDRIVIVPAETPITSATETALHDYPGGAFVEYDVHPEGTVSLEGTIYFIPEFFVTVLGKDFSQPFLEYPYDLPVATQDMVFDPVRVHVPLPDLERVAAEQLDFGAMSTGSAKLLTLDLHNIGEAAVRAALTPDDPASFEVLTPVVDLDPDQTTTVQVRFRASSRGVFESQLTIASNDPDQPIQTVALRAEAYEGDSPPSSDPSDDPAASTTGDSGGCGCRSSHRGAASLSWLLVLLGAVGLRRRTRTPATSSAHCVRAGSRVHHRRQGQQVRG